MNAAMTQIISSGLRCGGCLAHESVLFPRLGPLLTRLTIPRVPMVAAVPYSQQVDTEYPALAMRASQ